jgi:MoaA/NifB/PqqE/SkfB family radical SAM enzyme
MWQIEWIDIELTSFCNIHCEGCFRELSDYAKDINNKKILSLDTIKEKFKKEDFPGIKIINFCGSVDEPTTHPDFFKIIEHFADWEAHINIATNGSLRTAKWWTKLASTLPENHMVTFGVDGIDKTSELYRVGSKFDIVQKNYRAFIKAGGRATWQFIVFEHNKHQEQEVKLVANKENFVGVKYIYSHRNDIKNTVHTKVERKESEGIECKYAAQNRIFVNHMGNVIPCCHLNSEMLEYSAGRKEHTKFTDILNDNAGELATNLKYNSVHDVLEGDVFNDIKESWTNTPVQKCYKTCKKKKHDIFIEEKI